MQEGCSRQGHSLCEALGHVAARVAGRSDCRGRSRRAEAGEEAEEAPVAAQGLGGPEQSRD